MSNIDTSPRNAFSIQRGVNLSHWLSQVHEPDEIRKQRATNEDLQQILEKGFDHVRIPLDEIQMWYDNAMPREDRWQELTDRISYASSIGLRCIVDLHIPRSHHFNPRPRGVVNTLWAHPQPQARFLRMWEEISNRLSSFSTDMVAYEILNEPTAPEPDKWNSLLEDTYHFLRTKEPERSLFAGPNRWQSVTQIDNMLPIENDPNFWLSVHYYRPFLLTHYGAAWTQSGTYSGPVHYPGLTVAPEDIVGLPGDLKEMVEDINEEGGIEIMRTQFRRCKRLADSRGVNLHCGEFSALPSVPEELRLRWFNDIVSTFNEFSIAWSIWDYRGGFRIRINDTREWDDKLLEVLMK